MDLPVPYTGSDLQPSLLHRSEGCIKQSARHPRQSARHHRQIDIPPEPRRRSTEVKVPVEVHIEVVEELQGPKTITTSASSPTAPYAKRLQSRGYTYSAVPPGSAHPWPRKARREGVLKPAANFPSDIRLRNEQHQRPTGNIRIHRAFWPLSCATAALKGVDRDAPPGQANSDPWQGRNLPKSDAIGGHMPQLPEWKCCSNLPPKTSN